MSDHVNNDDALLEELKQLSAADNDRAISLLYAQYFQRLIFFAISFVKTREAAEEVVEDVLIKMWANKAGIAQITNLKVYLFTAVKNQSLNHLDKQAKFRLAEALPDEHSAVQNGSPSPLEHLILSEMNQALQVAVDSLPEQCRMIFRLIREDGFKYKEVAEILNISVNTIDNQMAIAVRRICAALQLQKKQPVYFRKRSS